MKKHESVVNIAFFMRNRLLKALLVVSLMTVSSAMAEPIYTLTPIDYSEAETNPERVIGKIVVDKQTGEITEKFYRVDFNKTTFGEGDKVREYQWDYNNRLREIVSPASLYTLKQTITVKGDELPTIGGLNPYYGDSVKNVISDFIFNDCGLSNWDTIETISGDFVGNYTGIYNSGVIGNINGKFIMNNFEGAIYNDGGSVIGNITADFIGNINSQPGGAISNFGEIGKISNSQFEDNTSLGAGGAIINYYQEGLMDVKVFEYRPSDTDSKPAPMEIVNSKFINNGAVRNQRQPTSLIDDYYNQPEKAYGGAILTTEDLKITADNGTTEFTDNFVVDSNRNVENQAIYVVNKHNPQQMSGPLNIMPLDVYDDVNDWRYKDSQTTLTLNAKNNGKVIVNDKIAGSVINLKPYWTDYMEGRSYNNTAYILYQYDENGNILAKDDYEFGSYKLEITGDKSGVVQLNNDIVSDEIYYYYREEGGDLKENSIIADEELSPGFYIAKATGAVDVSLDNVTLHLGARDNVLDGNNLTLNSGTLNMINNMAGTAALNNLTVAGNTNMLVDVDLANSQMDRITAKEYGKHNGNIVVSGMNLLSDAKDDRTEILFAEVGLKDNVKSGLKETGSKYQTTAYTPIYKYNVSYDNRDDAGYFLFDRAGAYSSNPSDSFNPAVLSSSASAQAGTQSALNETVRFAFQHMDMFSQMPSHERMALINQNTYAIQDVQPKYNSNFETLNKGYWVKPFTTFESIDLHNGPSVDAITYGTLIGFDGNFRKLKHDWYNVQSIYAGYIGSQMSYTGVDTSLNGGVLGLTETFYKGNLFSALTATAGATLADSSTMYGKEDFTSLLGGIGAKTGYNFEFKNGKYILQPIMFMNYAFVNTFDYTNAAKVKISSDPMHSVQINPQVKFVANLDKGWQPYASVGFVWNVLNSSKVRANNVVLPSMSVDPYVEYGVGLQRTWKDSFTGFGQAMVRNGGRNGVALTFGFRWALGKSVEEL